MTERFMRLYQVMRLYQGTALAVPNDAALCRALAPGQRLKPLPAAFAVGTTKVVP